jgi:hypothetical protein
MATTTKTTQQVKRVTRDGITTTTETVTTATIEMPDTLPQTQAAPRPLPVWAYIGACICGIVLAPIIGAMVRPAPVKLPPYIPHTANVMR